MTTSPEALREAVERLTEFESLSVETGAGYALLHVYGNEEDGPTAVFGLSADLRAVLSTIQEAMEPFARAVDDGDDNSAHDETPLWDHSLGDRIAVGHFRRAAEVYRALSPGGADET